MKHENRDSQKCYAFFNSLPILSIFPYHKSFDASKIPKIFERSHKYYVKPFSPKNFPNFNFSIFPSIYKFSIFRTLSEISLFPVRISRFRFNISTFDFYSQPFISLFPLAISSYISSSSFSKLLSSVTICQHKSPSHHFAPAFETKGDQGRRNRDLFFRNEWWRKREGGD